MRDNLFLNRNCPRDQTGQTRSYRPQNCQSPCWWSRCCSRYRIRSPSLSCSSLFPSSCPCREHANKKTRVVCSKGAAWQLPSISSRRSASSKVSTMRAASGCLGATAGDGARCRCRQDRARYPRWGNRHIHLVLHVCYDLLHGLEGLGLSTLMGRREPTILPLRCRQPNHSKSGKFPASHIGLHTLISIEFWLDLWASAEHCCTLLGCPLVTTPCYFA